MVILLVILTLYIFVYNLAMYFPAISFGVRVEQFYVWLKMGFSLFSFKVKNTEFGMGILPLGGYLKFSGMLLDKDEVIQPYHFKGVSDLKQLIIMISGPLICFFIGLIYYLIRSGVRPDFFQQTGIFIAFLIVTIVLFSLLSKSLKRNASSGFKPAFFIVSVLFYALILLGFGIYINTTTPFFEELNLLFSGQIKFKNLDWISAAIPTIAPFLGVFFFFINILPFAGLNGLLIVGLTYEILTGTTAPEKVINSLQFISLPALLIAYGWLTYLLFF